VAPMQVVGRADVVVSEVPQAAVPAGAVRDLGEVVGQFTRLGLAPGEVVTQAAMLGTLRTASAYDERLAVLAGLPSCQAASTHSPELRSKTTSSHLTLPAVCRNLVAMTLALSAQQGFAMVRSGDHVDILAVFGDSGGGIAQALLRNVPVLRSVTNGQQGSGDSGWVVVALPTDQALQVALASVRGTVDVVLRPPGIPPLADAPTPVTEGSLLDQEHLPADAGTLPPAAGA